VLSCQFLMITNSEETKSCTYLWKLLIQVKITGNPVLSPVAGVISVEGSDQLKTGQWDITPSWFGQPSFPPRTCAYNSLPQDFCPKNPLFFSSYSFTPISAWERLGKAQNLYEFPKVDSVTWHMWRSRIPNCSLSSVLLLFFLHHPIWMEAKTSPM